MSTEVIANAFLATCESSIKSLSQNLATLHSIDALHRLWEKADVVEDFLAIVSFAPFVAPPPPPAPPMTVDDGGPLGEARIGRFECQVETASRDRLVVAGGRQDGTVTLTHTPILPQPPMLQDGRDDDVISSSQSPFGTSGQHVVPLEHFIHPKRQSELTPFAPKEKLLYSFLIHFPVFVVVGARPSRLDRKELSELPAMVKWGFGNAMTTLAYPRLRLTNKGTACIVVDDDLERLEKIRKDLKGAEREIWEKSVGDIMLSRTFFFVGTWKEEHVALAFSPSTLL